MTLSPDGYNTVYKSNERTKVIDIFRLAYECKKYANLKGYIIKSYFDVNSFCGNAEVIRFLKNSDGECVAEDYNTHICHALSEPEAVFEACSWIINQQKQSNQGDKQTMTKLDMLQQAYIFVSNLQLGLATIDEYTNDILAQMDKIETKEEMQDFTSYLGEIISIVSKAKNGNQLIEKILQKIILSK